jgi:hypothetical protein
MPGKPVLMPRIAPDMPKTLRLMQQPLRLIKRKHKLRLKQKHKQRQRQRLQKKPLHEILKMSLRLHH